MKDIIMEKNIKKFLQFNGKNVYFLSVDGTYYIAIKPICEALGVDYSRQLRTLKEDEILSGAWSLQTIHDSTNRLQEMACISEYFVYGWIFKIQSQSEQLAQYQWKCYEILHNYFHGAITERTELLKVKTLAEIEKEKLKEELMETPAYQKLKALEEKEKETRKALLRLNKDTVSNQMDLWQS